ncbi:unnamed protein product [Rotaria sp. Silwood1]|nr:unnamed protein product [Rotaria sp. Silwood1]CAF3726582.1 unnamed protein product [Rotaria sp. Silwood1]CAF4961536.1 unnamed protein product [Rotaria sp. Silwood1]
MVAESANGAIVRTVNTLSKPISSSNLHSSALTGEIRLYSGNTSPLPQYWVFCHGQELPRLEYARLFSVIGVSYGNGDGQTTFNVPDFRGRFPLGVDESQIRIINAKKPGLMGGYETHQLSIEQLPSHQHNKGSLTILASGSHTHPYTDPGHDHGGKTGDGPFENNSVYGLKSGGISEDHGRHSHTIARDTTHIVIHEAGTHSHGVEGETGTAGAGQRFSLMNPYQTVQYIIYTN